MKSSIRDKIEGTGHQTKGMVKENIGKLTNNPTMEVDGIVEKIAGKAQHKIGEAKKVYGK